VADLQTGVFLEFLCRAHGPPTLLFACFRCAPEARHTLAQPAASPPYGWRIYDLFP